jgi:hypothetical protein
MTVIRAELVGSTYVRAGGVTVTGHDPIPRLCRALLKIGLDPATSLEAYRGEELCLRVRSIGEAALERARGLGVGPS